MFADAMKVFRELCKAAGEVGVGNLGQAKFGHALFLSTRIIHWPEVVMMKLGKIEFRLMKSPVEWKSLENAIADRE
jgi:hypothetical protein